MKCDIIAYDYSGYGYSEGKANELQINSDIEEVGSFATNILMVKPNYLIPFGISIGSMPSVNLAQNKDYNNIPGMVLLSPYSLGFNQKLTKEEDIEYYEKIKNIECPIFLIHGQKDSIIPFAQSEGLASKIKTLFKWFPSKADHDNIISNHRCKFYRKLKTFMNELLIQKNQLRVSFKITFNSPSVKKKKIIINSNYAENAESFDANIANDQGKDGSTHELLFDLCSDDGQAYSDDDFSYERHSKSIKKIGKLYFGKENAINEEDILFDESYFSDTEFNIAKDDIIITDDNNLMTSSFKSPIKSSLTSVIKSATISKKKSFCIGTSQKSPLLTNSIKKMHLNNKKRNIISQKTFNYKKMKTGDIDLKEISDFPDLE